MSIWVKTNGVYTDPLTAAQGDHLNVGMVKKKFPRRVRLWDDYQDTPALKAAKGSNLSPDMYRLIRRAIDSNNVRAVVIDPFHTK